MMLLILAWPSKKCRASIFSMGPSSFRIKFNPLLVATQSRFLLSRAIEKILLPLKDVGLSSICLKLSNSSLTMLYLFIPAVSVPTQIKFLSISKEIALLLEIDLGFFLSLRYTV
jgi:hypothetical protein